jgi:hypothetical protein
MHSVLLTLTNSTGSQPPEVHRHPTCKRRPPTQHADPGQRHASIEQKCNSLCQLPIYTVCLRTVECPLRCVYKQSPAPLSYSNPHRPSALAYANHPPPNRANEYAQNANRKTIAPADVFKALEDLEFDFKDRLEAELASTYIYIADLLIQTL